MGRKCLIIVAFLTVALCKLTAQSGASFDFIQNKGQWQKEVKYKGEFSNGAFFLEQRGFSVIQYNSNDLAAFRHRQHDAVPVATKTSQRKTGTKVNGRTVVDNENLPPSENGGGNSNAQMVRSHMYRVTFEGASENASLLPDKSVITYNNYFIGNDPSKWASHVPLYQAITYKDIYPNIDIRYYSDNGRLKYDIVVNPGGDVSRIAMRYDGADKLSVKNDELIIKTSIGDSRELAPYSYQFDKISGKKEVTCSYVVSGNIVKFKTGDYSKNSTLIIDPTLVFCSFTGSTADQYGFTATPGPGGTLVSGGIVFGSGFRTNPGAYQENFQGGNGSHPNDMGIFKFSADGSQRVYATYVGSASGNDYPHSIICDPQGNLVILGRTYGSDYPGTVIEKSPNSAKGCDIVVTKLSADGSSLIGSLRIGGGDADGYNIHDIQSQGIKGFTSIQRFYGDDSRSEVVLDAANNIYVAAQTQSSDFPIKGTVFQKTLGGGQDGVVMKINPNCTDVIWSSYLGGTANDGAFVISVNPSNGEILVGGSTESTETSFPGDKTGAYQDKASGGADGYVCKIANDGSAILKTTFLGTNQYDAVYGIQFDKTSIPYIMGTTEGAWPVINATYSVPNSSQFVAKLKPDLSGFIYSTVFGSGESKPNISPVAFLVDRCENVYISGWGGWINRSNDPYGMVGPKNMGATPDALKSQAQTDNKDFYFIVIKRDATARLYATYFGQTGGEGEHVDGGTSRYDQEGVIYQAICANCFGNNAGTPITAPFPTTPGVWAERNGTGENACNLAAVKIAFNFAGVGTGVKSFVNGVGDTVGCVPFTVEFRDTIHNARTYIWDFGDGSGEITTNNYIQSHTYNAVGTFRVRLIAVDSTTCNIRDTSYTTIRVRDDPASINFDFTKLAPCESLSYRFDNLSAPATGKVFNDTSFIWDFGDGTRIKSGPAAITHAYAGPGTYNVKLILVDTNFCNAPDSLSRRLSVAANVSARFETPAMGCVPYNAVFTNTSLGGATFDWDFGDGSPISHDIDPVHLYSNIGVYKVKMVAYDPNTCNLVDSTEFTITVNPNPVADFNYTPVTPLANTPTIFTNLSSGGTQYKWLFGDGDSTIKNTMDTVKHQYNATGTYTVCLITTNQYGCSDTACKDVKAIINPLLDVPNAFTPGRFGTNSIIKVAGFGIGKMTWRIYNRFGQKVFESVNRNIGWDGTFNGKPMPMEVYAYTLEVEFTDGTKARKTGDITLIR